MLVPPSPAAQAVFVTRRVVSRRHRMRFIAEIMGGAGPSEIRALLSACEAGDSGLPGGGMARENPGEGIGR